MTRENEHLSRPKRTAADAVASMLSRAASYLLAAALSTLPLPGQVPNNLTFTNQTVASGTYQAANSITADAGNGSATTTVSSGANVIFQSGTKITLLPNFHAAPGSSFVASITGSPLITGLSQTSGPVGASVVISGINFGSAQGSSTVTFNGAVATVTNWSAFSITASVPSGASTGNVVVTVGGLASNSEVFTVTQPQSGVKPRTVTAGSCGKPDCETEWSTLTFVSPNTFYADAYSFWSGPDVNAFWQSYASANVFENDSNFSPATQDLGNECSNGSWGYQAFNVYINLAAAQAPCSGQYWAVADGGNRTYWVTGTHASDVNNSVVNTYSYLGFAAAGSHRYFNYLDQDPFSNFSNASAPQASPSDISVSYTGQSTSWVSVLVSVPYTAANGIHSVSFPTTDNYGDPEQNTTLQVLVFDATPNITTAGVSPNPIPVGPQSLTIKGSGFGTHPTVYVNGTAYSATASQDPSGNDVVDIVVTLPASLVGKNIPIYVVSNGHGNAPFLGAPEGEKNGQAQMDAPTGNTVQVPVISEPTAITAMCSPPANPCAAGATATVQIEATAVPFEIDGTDLGNGALSVSSGPLSNVVITSYSNTSITGTFSVNILFPPGQYTVTVSPSGATTTINVVAGQSTVGTNNPGIWFLGAASTNDSCAATGVCYYNSTVVSLDEIGYQAPPTAEAPATWQLVDPRTGQPPTFASMACNDPSCASVTVTATSMPPSTSCTPGIQIQATLAQLTTPPITLWLDGPGTASTNEFVFDQPQTSLGTPGYLSQVEQVLRSVCQQPMFSMDLHEEFPAPWQPCGGSAGWTDAIPQQPGNGSTGWGGWLTGPSGEFPDFIGYECAQGVVCTPAPACPAGDCTGATRLGTSSVANASVTQSILVGSQSIVPLGKYAATTPNIQVRYTDNGRDQPATWSCPAH